MNLRVFILRWINTTIGVVVATWFIPHGLHYERPMDLVWAALILGIFNAVLRPVLLTFALPLLVLTLGFLFFIINGLLLYLVGWLLAPGFEVRTFWSAVFGAFIITVISFILNLLTGTNRARVSVTRNQPPPSNPPGGGGPIIDV